MPHESLAPMGMEGVPKSTSCDHKRLNVKAKPTGRWFSLESQGRDGNVEGSQRNGRRRRV